MEIRSIRALASGADLDLDTVASLARLTPEALAAVRLDLPEPAARRLARVLGVELEDVVVAREEGEDPIYDDTEPVRVATPEPTQSREPDPEDLDPTPPFERALLGVMAEGDYEEEDRDQVVAVLSQGTLPSTVTPRELPALARVWLEGARALRLARVPDEDRGALLLETVAAGDHRAAARLATSILEALKRRGAKKR